MKVRNILVAAAALCLAGTALAVHAQNLKPEAQVGEIVSVEADGKVMVDTGDKVITVTTDDQTLVTIDGKKSKVSDLGKGMHAVVTPARGTAAAIAATTRKPGIR